MMALKALPQYKHHIVQDSMYDYCVEFIATSKEMRTLRISDGFVLVEEKNVENFLLSKMCLI